MRSILKLLLTCTLLSFGSASMALQRNVGEQADSRSPAAPPSPELVIEQGSGMTLDQAVEQVRRQYPGGKIVSAETRGGKHIIKVLTADGTVRTVRIPAR